MTSNFDFDQYWGVRLRNIEYDCAAMSVAFDLYWTAGSLPFSARLLFEGVSTFDFVAEKVYESDVVELISIEGKKERAGWKITGELSNYEFDIFCANIKEIKNPHGENS